MVLGLDFNPNYIISDDELQNVGSMNRSDIQAFLENQHSYLSTYHALDASSTDRLASDIIYHAAQDYAINPKYLLVKLQKEQSLITDPDPSERQLNWATGYAVCDSCSTTDPSLQKFKGFGVQVDKAAGVMRWYFDNLNNFDWIKRANTAYTIDNTSVTPANLATAFLYTYTPHLHGNKNFWTLWQTWFDQVYPDGTLLQATGGKTIYVLSQGKKRPFATMAALVSRYNPKQVLTVPPSELARYGDGTAIALPNYSLLHSTNGTYYLLDYDIARPFASEAVVRNFGYNPQEILEVTDSDLADYTTGSIITADIGAPAGKLVRLKETKQVYYLKDNNFHSLPDEQMAGINHPGLSIAPATITDLASYEQGSLETFKDGTLLGVKGGHDIFVIDAGKKRHITSAEVFLGLGYSWNNIVWVSELTSSLHETGAPVYLRPAVNIAAVSGDTSGESPQVAAIQIPPSASDSTTTLVIDEFTGPVFATTVPTYLVADAATQTILAGKNINTLRPAASLTKVATAYQLLLDGLSVQRSVTYNPDTQSADTVFRLVRGEQVLNEHLMEAMLVSSLNTPSRMLASTLQISESQFITNMNTTASTLGLTSTHFTDTSGLDLGNLTTAKEYLPLYTRATKNSTLARIMGMSTYTYDEMRDVDGKPHHTDVHTNALMSRTDLPFRIITSKTGYLPEAGNHLIMHIERLSDHKQFFVITMGNPDKANKFVEPERLARWTVQNF